MSSNTAGLSDCCVSGHLHSGQPKGQYGPLGDTGLDAYVTGSESNKSKTIIFLTDICMSPSTGRADTHSRRDAAGLWDRRRQIDARRTPSC